MCRNLREVHTAALDINSDGFWVLKSTGRGLDNPPAAAVGDKVVDAPVHALETGLLFSYALRAPIDISKSLGAGPISGCDRAPNERRVTCGV